MCRNRNGSERSFSFPFIFLISFCVQLCVPHVHVHYNDPDVSQHHHNNEVNYTSDGGGGYSVENGGDGDDDEEEPMHNDGGGSNSYFFLGHPTGVAVHPMSLMHNNGNDKQSNISDQKSEDKVTDILHGLLAKYDSRIRPFAPDHPAMIKVSIGDVQVVEVDESRSEFSSAILLQQTWLDPRLVYDLADQAKEVPYITISHEHTRELWLPDTYFLNEKRAEVHEVTMTNDAVLLFRNGTVVRSMRITVSTHCPFNYDNFPFETQQCELLIGSHGYGIEEINLYWDEDLLLQANSPPKNHSTWTSTIVSNVHTGKFIVTSLNLNESTTPSNLGPRSRLSLQLTLQRAWRPFITRFYLPMILFVFVSLRTLFLQDLKVGFIVNLFNLAFINIFVAIRSTSGETPRTSSRTALDTYFMLCLGYVVVVILITVWKLVKNSNKSGYQQGQSEILASPAAQSSFGVERRISPNRRRNTDQLDIFNPINDNNGHPHHNGHDGDSAGSIGAGHLEGESEYERIYNSPSYPLHLSSRTRVVLGKVERFLFWLGKYLRWILLISFLVTDYVYFKTHKAPYT